MFVRHTLIRQNIFHGIILKHLLTYLFHEIKIKIILLLT